MIDIIAYGIDYGIVNGRHLIEIPSVVFVKKCEETAATWDRNTQGPLPPY